MAKRYIFAYEGVDEEGRRLMPEAMKWEDQRYPVVWNFNFDTPEGILGHAHNIQRDESTGAISCVIEWNQTHAAVAAQSLFDHREVACSFFIDQLISAQIEGRRGKKVMAINSGRLRAVVVIPKPPGWNRPDPTEENDDEKSESMEGS